MAPEVLGDLLDCHTGLAVTGDPHDIVAELRDFTATAPNRLWLADITEHRTTEGKLYPVRG